MVDLERRVRNVSQCLQENNLTISSYVGYVMSSKKLAQEQSSLAQQAISIYETFYRYLPSCPSVTSWALKIAKDALGQDRLTGESATTNNIKFPRHHMFCQALGCGHKK